MIQLPGISTEAAAKMVAKVKDILFRFQYMAIEEERKDEIKKAFFEYAEHNELSAFDTAGYFARQILPSESFFMKANVIQDLIDSGVMVTRGERWIIKK